MNHLDNRRILFLPAVYPCEAISPASLLSSLIAICKEILDKRVPCSYPIHKKAISEAIREAGVLLGFFEEFLGSDIESEFPKSVVICLSELHFALQKIRFLFQDCSRRGAKFWMLMKSELVLTEFRIQMRCIATSLDILPLESIDVSDETKELVRLLSIQAWKVEVGLDRPDSRAIRTVRSILSLFKRGVNPHPVDLIRVLDHLKIRTWSDCNDELAFLEEEIFTHLEEGGDQVTFLSGLTGFIFYCRVVLFNSIDSKRVERKEPVPQSKSLDWLNPDDLQCPISLELMTYPVMICTGQTYDRVSITKWIKSGCHSCPITGKSLSNTDLLPNLAIRKLIEQLCQRNNISFSELSTKHRRRVDKTSVPFSPASGGAMKLAVSFLVQKISEGDIDEKRKATYETRKMSKSNIFNRACLVEANSIPWLLYLLSSPDPLIQDNAVATLLNISKQPIGQKALFESGGTGLVIDLIKYGLKNEVKQNAAAIIFYLSSIKAYRIEICSIPEAVPALVNLLSTGTHRGMKNAAVSIYGLLESPENHAKILSAGTVPVLVNLLGCERGDIIYDAVAVLEKIAERYEGTMAVLKNAEVSQIVDVIGSSALSTSRSCKENCISLLLSLCVHGGNKVANQLGKISVFMSALYTLILEGTSQGKKKAKTLLDLIHESDETDCLLAEPRNQTRDRVVHAL